MTVVNHYRLAPLLIYSAIVILNLGSCSEKPVQGDRVYAISGTVFDKATKTPVEGAEVEFLKFNTHPYIDYTDTVGEFLIEFMGGGEPVVKESRLILSKEGYSPFVLVIPAVVDDIKNLMIEIERP